jgi:hypothetical protein
MILFKILIKKSFKKMKMKKKQLLLLRQKGIVHLNSWVLLELRTGLAESQILRIKRITNYRKHLKIRTRLMK